MGSRCDTSTHLWPQIFTQQASISYKAYPTSWNCVVRIFKLIEHWTSQRSRRKQLKQCSSVIPLSPRNCGSASSSEGGWSPQDGFTIPGVTSPPEAKASECSKETPLNKHNHFKNCWKLWSCISRQRPVVSRNDTFLIIYHPSHGFPHGWLWTPEIRMAWTAWTAWQSAQAPSRGSDFRSALSALNGKKNEGNQAEDEFFYCLFLFLFKYQSLQRHVHVQTNSFKSLVSSILIIP